MIVQKNPNDWEKLHIYPFVDETDSIMTKAMSKRLVLLDDDTVLWEGEKMYIEDFEVYIQRLNESLEILKECE